MSGVQLSKHFLPEMIKRNWGRIIFISSECATLVPSDLLSYSVSKASINVFSSGLAKLTKGTNVTINTVIPGSTLSEGSIKFLEETAKRENKTVEDVEKYIIVGGADEFDGEINWNIKTDDYRIISGGREGADIGDQQVLTTSVEISLNWFIELLLAIISLTLFLGAGEMAFPIKKLFMKFRDS